MRACGHGDMPALLTIGNQVRGCVVCVCLFLCVSWFNSIVRACGHGDMPALLTIGNQVRVCCVSVFVCVDCVFSFSFVCEWD